MDDRLLGDVFRQVCGLVDGRFFLELIHSFYSLFLVRREGIVVALIPCRSADLRVYRGPLL